ncbi:hypothetical protein C1H46_036764 [Malus baccata]|uniref:Uncharacterized protein n=1 Tax=Malus baccata TaxID=106549 RepID=A0A540KU02_MALBA|nr:hypothetical protein C1H46_036764 [Malus baccata]
MVHGILIWSLWAIWSPVLKIFQNFKSNIKFGGSHLTTCLLLHSCFFPVKDNYMLSPLQRSGISSEWCLHHLTFFMTAWFWAFSCPLCAGYRLRARNVAIDMGMVSLEIQVWHFFPGIVTMMGLSCALCSGSSWFYGLLVIFIVSTMYAAGEAMFRVIRFFCVVTFRPLQSLSFWAPM